MSKKVYPCELQLFFYILLLLSTGTEILQALGNLPELSRVGIMVPVVLAKRCPDPQNGLLGSTETSDTKMQGCEDLKEPFLLPLINSRENKGFCCLLPKSVLCQLSKKAAPEQGKLPGCFSLSAHLLLQRSRRKGQVPSLKAPAPLFTSLLTPCSGHCSGHSTGC